MLAGGVLAILGFVVVTAFLFESNVLAINPSTDFLFIGTCGVLFGLSVVKLLAGPGVGWSDILFAQGCDLVS
jgi:hypothetical protein